MIIATNSGVTGPAVLTIALLLGGWFLAVLALIDAIRRRAGGDEEVGPWVVFLAFSLIAAPIAGLVALAYLVGIVVRRPPARRDLPMTTVGRVSPLSLRLWARLIDFLIIGLPLVILTWNISTVDIDRRIFDTPAWWTWTSVAIGFSYEVVLVVACGATVGKLLTQLRVVDAGVGSRPSWRAGLLRASPILVGRIPLLGTLGSIAYLPMLWRSDRRGFHDQLAGTIVIYEPRTRSRPARVRFETARDRDL